MKREKIVTFLTGFGLSCLLSFGAIGAMISGLDLPVEDMDRLYTAWLISACLGCILFSFKKGWIPVLLIAVAGVGFLLKHPVPSCALITRLSWIYDSAYNWGILEFSWVNWRTMALDLPLGAWGCLLALAAAGTVVWGHGLIPTLILALLPVGSTVVVTNTAPDSPYVFAVMVGLILLLLTATVRRHSPHQAAKLTVLTALPVTLLLGLLFAACPQDTYVNRAEEYLNSVVSWWQSNIASAWDTSGLLGQSVGFANETPTTNLSLLGPRANWRYAVMDVTSANESGTFYLRGQDYDIYDGANWTATADREEYWGASWDNSNTITISTRRRTNVLYLPYYPANPKNLTGGRLENEEGLTEYTVTQSVIPAYLDALMHYPSSGSLTSSDARISDDYIALPEDTLVWAAAYLDEHIPEVWDVSWTAMSHDEYQTESLSNTEIAALIAGHVRASARYDKGTTRMDRDYGDFARWFLEESETGYCVHFATAAAVLLRAAEVPARYVTGYMATCEAGETTTVRADQAHAWVEYYEPIIGNWVILEATPPDLGDTETEPTEQTEATEETEPPTEETTAPPTEGQDQTRPADATRPGEQEDPKLDLTPLWTSLKWLLVPLGLWLLVLIQYALRRGLRRHHRSPNARALAKWQDAELLCRVKKQKPPEELEALAQKAKFSQHTLTAEELHTFDAWLKAERKKPMPWYQRFVCRYVLALW